MVFDAERDAERASDDDAVNAESQPVGDRRRRLKAR